MTSYSNRPLPNPRGSIAAEDEAGDEKLANDPLKEIGREPYATPIKPALKTQH